MNNGLATLLKINLRKDHSTVKARWKRELSYPANVHTHLIFAIVNIRQRIVRNFTAAIKFESGYYTAMYAYPWTRRDVSLIHKERSKTFY